jgi:phosphopantothenoylcysteine decarboxylase
MANILLGVTGSVAALKTPELHAALTRAGHQVKIVATKSATYFFDVAGIAPLVRDRAYRNPDVVILDEDEWPGRRYERGDRVLHIELRRWADLFAIAPLDANTLAKLANGLSDNCLTCIWRAWDRTRPVVLAPAMNTLMWEHPFTLRHLRQLVDDVPAHLPLDEVLAWINAHCANLHIVGPQSKRLACDDVGMGAMADVDAIVGVCTSLLAGKK